MKVTLNLNFLWNPILWICALVAAFLIRSDFVWIFSSHTFVAPVQANSFDSIVNLLGHYRIVLHPFFIHPLLLWVTILPLVALATITYLTYLITPSESRALRMLIAAAVSLILLKSTAPGTNATSMLKIASQLFILLPLLRPLPPIALWGVATGSMFVAAANPEFRFLIFWISFSLLLSGTFTFLLADRAMASFRVRHEFVRGLLPTVALGITALWSLLTSLWLGLPQNTFELSSLWWLSWIAAGLGFYITWRHPWDLKRWLALVSFCQGIIFSPSMEFAALIVIAWMVAEILLDPANLNLPFMGFTQKISWKWIFPSILLAEFVTGLALMQSTPPKRDFDIGWVAISKTVPSEDKPLVLLGHGLPYLSYLYRGELISTDEIALKTDENAFDAYLKELGASEVIVEEAYLTQLWKDWIRAGNDPDIANESVLSRLINYGGQSVETKTLKLPKIQHFQKVELPEIPGFAVIRPISSKTN